MSETDAKVRTAGEPVGRGGIRVDVSERPAWCLGAGGALVAALLLFGGPGALLVVVLPDSLPPMARVGIAAGAVMTAVVLFCWMLGFTIVAPGDTRVVQFFGRYVGTLRRTGLQLSIPLSNRKKVSVKVHNFETSELKVNDANGNPITIAGIVVWQVADTAKATFAVEDYEEFVKVQSEAALRHVAMSHPYDDVDDAAVSLRGDTDSISRSLADEVAHRVSIAGIEIVEVRISSLAYAPEIAQAMLQRQQASAVVAAREQIVDGAVGMVEKALERLEEREFVDLDDERKAAMVSNLLVVLCSERGTTPVVNASSLYT